jgi:hypothetical protein
VESGLGGQAAFTVAGGFFLGFLTGFLMAGYRMAGPE